METIKIITLLVKISNQEEVPKMVKYADDILTYDEETQDYYNEPECTYALFNDIHRKLNDEVEIIEDIPKEDTKIQPITDEVWELNNSIIKNKINEIIDKINEE